MFKHLLAPLDGSTLAEAVMPVVCYLAKSLQTTVTLFHVIEPNAPAAIHGDRHITERIEAQSYLADVARRFLPDQPVAQHVHTGGTDTVAQSIAAHASELKADLIVMSTHGRGGVHSWLFGSNAQQVIALGVTPVLLLDPAKVTPTKPFLCRRLLAALDGDPDHEQGATLAAALAAACRAELHLVTVVPTFGTLSKRQAVAAQLLPSTTIALLDLTEQKAQDYLQSQVARLGGPSVVITAEVGRGDTATVIIACAQRVGADLIVLGTHGKPAQDAFWSGSVTPKIASRSHLPLLLAPIRAAPGVE